MRAMCGNHRAKVWRKNSHQSLDSTMHWQSHIRGRTKDEVKEVVVGGWLVPTWFLHLQLYASPISCCHARQMRPILLQARGLSAG